MKKSKISILVFVVIWLLGNSGCVKMVDSYKKFNIEGFEEFFDINSSEEQQRYINSGKLDSYKREEILFIPFIKESNDTECVILILPYSQKANNRVKLEEVTLMTAEGDIICFTEEYGEIEVFSEWSDTMVLIDEFEKSEKWFYDEKELVLNIKANIINEKNCIPTEIFYNVTIRGYRGTTLQV